MLTIRVAELGNIQPGIRPHRAQSLVRFGKVTDEFVSRFNTSDLFAKALKNEGVDCVYGVPGEETLHLLEALRKAGIPFITSRDEESAGFMAATYGRLTGKPGVCLTTLGPGATKLTTPAAYATLGGMPLVLITGQKPIHQNKQGLFQLVDVSAVLHSKVKSTNQVENGHMVPKLVREAFRLATSERPGAVHLELPEDVAAERMDPNTDIFPVEQPSQTIADPTSIRKALEMLSQAKRPVLLIGGGAKRQEAQRALRAFIQKTGIPFITTQMGKGTIDEHHPLYLGTTALSDQDYIHDVINQADLVLSVGHELEEKPPFLMQHPAKPPVINLSATPAGVDNTWFPQLQVVGNIANSITRLRRGMPKTQSSHTSFYQWALAYMHQHLLIKPFRDQVPIPPWQIVADVQKAMPQNGIVALDNGMYKIWFARHFKASHPNGLLLDNALATMGAGLPSALEAAHLYPTKKVMAVCGDGGFIMSLPELETAVRLKLNLVILVLNNNGYGMIQWKQKAQGLPDYGLTFGNPDFVKLAESFGVKGHRVSQATDLIPLIKQSLAAHGIHLIEVPIDYSDRSELNK